MGVGIVSRARVFGNIGSAFGFAIKSCKKFEAKNRLYYGLGSLLLSKFPRVRAT